MGYYGEITKMKIYNLWDALVYIFMLPAILLAMIFGWPMVLMIFIYMKSTVDHVYIFAVSVIGIELLYLVGLTYIFTYLGV